MQLLQNILYFAIWAGFIFLMMRYGCGAHIMGHGHHHGATGSGDHGGDSSMRFRPPHVTMFVTRSVCCQEPARRLVLV